ncbi:MAG: DNA polymerase III subunit gamma/tau [Rikenellaceae bacterium]|nr:DNA polymerase III subunit gamma/tau [Rikenellaceae bacterium]
MDNFVVSARKYRPQTFASVVGQGSITSTLKNAIERGQLAGAYLFCGPRGVGKTTCARIFAKAINCQNPNGAEACNECESCRAFNEGRSFNIHELDAASNNSVNDIRNLTDQVRVPPQIGRYSVYIIDEVHMLSAAAFNAFLKTLEEPPSYAIFILATTEKHKILPTILSRCQIFDFNRIRVEDGVEYMRSIAAAEGVSYDDESLNLIAAKADGGMRDALSMFDKAVAFCGSKLNYRDVAASLNVLDYETYFRVVDTLRSGDYAKSLLQFDEILSRGFGAAVFLQGLAAHMRSLLVCKQPSTAHLLEVTGSVREHYMNQAGECEVEFLFDAIRLLAAVDGQLKTSSNQRLAVELALMKLSGMGQKKNFDLNDDLPLPELIREGQGAESQNNTSASAAPVASKPEVTETSSATPQTAAPRPAAQPMAASAQPQLQPQSVAQEVPTTVTASVAATQTERPATPTKSSVGGSAFGGLGGSSIMSLLSNKSGETTEQDDKPEEVVDTRIDPEAEAKIKQAQAVFVEAMMAERQRIGVAFEDMAVSGNCVTITVGSDDLRQEILRSQYEILSLLAEKAGVIGAIELEVNVTADKPRAEILIKPEDKVHYLCEQNPGWLELRTALDLDIE